TFLLLNVLGRARASAHMITCMSNLKQLGLAFHLYAEANDDLLPYPTKDFGYQITWFNAIDPHLSGPQAATNNANQWLHLIKQDPIIKNLGAAWFSNAYTIKMNNELGNNYPSGQCFYAVHNIQNPALTVLLFDGRAELEKKKDGTPSAEAMH